MNLELKLYIEQEIIPRYDHFDQAHQRDHVTMVIQQSPSTTSGNLASVVSILGNISSLRKSFTVSNSTMEVKSA